MWRLFFETILAACHSVQFREHVLSVVTGTRCGFLARTKDRQAVGSLTGQIKLESTDDHP
jgi:pheromone shutdown protein TraB